MKFSVLGPCMCFVSRGASDKIVSPYDIWFIDNYIVESILTYKTRHPIANVN